LLDLLHQLSEGYFAVETEVVQLPAADNGHTAVCVARVRIFDSQDADVVRRLCTGIGDASPDNVSSQMRPHLLRMAETRAKARALRDAVNVGMAALEELGPDEGERPAPAPHAERTRAESSGWRRAEDTPVGEVGAEGVVIEGKRYTRAQVEAGYKKVVEEARAAGLALPGGTPGQAGQPGGDVVPLERTPLSAIVGRAQELRRRLDAKGGGPGT
jgi:hypothetical protein